MTINLNNFKQFIEAQILERGRHYFQDGYITEIEELDKNDFNAIVLGSEKYSVNIVLKKQDELFTHHCNCPYDFGPICKHKVAVLLLIKAHKKQQIEFPKGKLSEIKKELSNYSKQELFQLIMNLAKTSIEVREELRYELGLEE